MDKPMNTWEERFLESFGHDHPWNGECASVNMGNDCDCRTKGMLIFIASELQHQREEIVEKIEKLETHSNDWVTEDVVVKNDVLDIVKKVEGK